MSLTRSLTRPLTSRIARALSSPSAGGGAAPVIVGAILGTLADPAAGASDLNKGATQGMSPSLPVASTLKEFKCWASATGTVKLKVFQPIKGGGFNVISTQTLTCASTGLNTFSVAAGTLTEVAMPANSLVGFTTLVSGGATMRLATAAEGNGYWLQFGADFSGNGVAWTETTFSPIYSNEMQAQFTAEYTRGAESPGTYFIDENFASTIPPAFGVNQSTNAWTFAVAGQTTSAGTGLASFYDFYPVTNTERCTWAVEFIFTGASDRFEIHRKPLISASTKSGTIGEADVANNRLVLYETWDGSTTLPAIESTLTLTNLTLTTGVRYRMELTKVARVISLRIIDTTNSDEETLTVSGATTTALCGFANGRPGFANLAGSAQVKSCQLYSPMTTPNVLFLGDSITEGYSVTDAQNYAEQALSLLGGSGRIAANSSAVITEIQRICRQEMRLAVPEYVVIECVNNSASDALRDAFPAGLDQLLTLIDNLGATPVICTLPPHSNSSTNARVGVINSYILSLTGRRIVRFDTALSAGGDGTTYDATLMADAIHPNAAGHAAMFARLQADAPELFA